MKKGIKVILILAVVFLLIGIALCVASVAMGADPLKLLSDGTYTISVSDPIGHILDPDLYEGDREGSFGQRPGNFGEAESTGDTYSVSGDIKNLEIDWVSGNVKIIRGEGVNITFSESDSGGIDADDKLYYEVNGDTLKIECCRSGKVQIGINYRVPPERTLYGTFTGTIFREVTQSIIDRCLRRKLQRGLWFIG